MLGVRSPLASHDLSGTSKNRVMYCHHHHFLACSIIIFIFKWMPKSHLSSCSASFSYLLSCCSLSLRLSPHFSERKISLLQVAALSHQILHTCLQNDGLEAGRSTFTMFRWFQSARAEMIGWWNFGWAWLKYDLKLTKFWSLGWFTPPFHPFHPCEGEARSSRQSAVSTPNSYPPCTPH